MVEVISSLQPGSSPALLLEWSVQTAKRANGGGGALYVQFRINSLNWDNTTSNRRLRVRFK